MKFLVTASLLLAIWYVLSGRFDLLHFGTGVLAAVLIAASSRGVSDPTKFRFVRFLLYVPWLTAQVILSNLRVARMVFSPTMPIRPTFIRRRPGVTGPRALTALGVSITLTPGTLTVDVDADEVFVHALDSKSASDIREGRMARRLAGVFEERGT